MISRVAASLVLALALAAFAQQASVGGKTLSLTLDKQGKQLTATCTEVDITAAHTQRQLAGGNMTGWAAGRGSTPVTVTATITFPTDEAATALKDQLSAGRTLASVKLTEDTAGSSGRLLRTVTQGIDAVVTSLKLGGKDSTRTAVLTFTCARLDMSRSTVADSTLTGPHSPYVR